MAGAGRKNDSCLFYRVVFRGEYILVNEDFWVSRWWTFEEFKWPNSKKSFNICACFFVIFFHIRIILVRIANIDFLLFFVYNVT
ncbi:MAG: hypothetical protein A3J55_03580 [Candidatus Ryanbacteria bacterium RIFCSPHIGHO2_02_FULL_45_17b]|nr:MAG: hypothetical protein A3J55_03580 [Candidatus Ryanbacteria bacterium RIFCSPHIGHO2_02_FULL_45_17b]